MARATPKAEFDHKGFINSLKSRPGVYQMLDAEGQVLYVGKARDLKRRVSSYFSRSLNSRIQLMVSQIRDIQITVTQTEAEALLLENNLIKTLKPRYNVLLRDDKSYPYIYLANDHAFPRLTWHRGARIGKGRYFGPYPNVGAMRETLKLLQKLFPVRQCEDSFYQNRSRPCLQYQIQRCTAPCVGLVSEKDYALDVKHAQMFLEGKPNQVIDELVQRMEQASANLDYEKAAHYRDQIASLRRVQERQYVSGEQGDLDIIACVVKGSSACVQVFFVRSGRNLGNKVFFPKIPHATAEADALSAFLSQFYPGKQIPNEIIVNIAPTDEQMLENALAEQAGHKVRIRERVRAERARWLEMAIDNARLALETRLASKAGLRQRLEALQNALDLSETPTRMECFDISHTGGRLTVASCVVFDQQGPVKSDYRRFNINDITPGDDYAALEQAVRRRYTRIQKGEGRLADILFIDGGKGQLSAVAQVLEELGVVDILLVGVAKGPARKPGMEQLFLNHRSTPIILPPDSLALHLIQQIRDEAHRFAVAGHRQRRGREGKTSVLESIPGVGPKRRQQLLKQFGGMQELARAGVEDLARVDGISNQLAEKIYHILHGDI